MSSSRKHVLELYRKLLKCGKTWQAGNPAETNIEREYIQTNVKNLFRQYQTIQEEEHIRELIEEGERRMEMAIHYKIPYERPTHVTTIGGVVMKRSKK
jgi:hypothetical protein